MKQYKLDLIGALLVLIGLSGLPWYIIKIRVSRDLWYNFSYSPFKLIIEMGDVVDADLFYRFDSTIVGIILLLMLLLRLIKTDILKMKYLAPLIMGLILIFFTSFLPIHVTTASRLVIGDGAYFILFGSALLIISSIINQLYSQ
ncbi:MAG: hypothetical protein QGG23_01910 [Candidatus Bathyarchaeota archaeon]|nr:hypothetical protein [Candidatus Bathyarchaeota archaeon]MDP7443890.1 hypothetical protein [Candidatus Bathyarchaeota archaeon]